MMQVEFCEGRGVNMASPSTSLAPYHFTTLQVSHLTTLGPYQLPPPPPEPPQKGVRLVQGAERGKTLFYNEKYGAQKMLQSDTLLFTISIDTSLIPRREQMLSIDMMPIMC